MLELPAWAVVSPERREHIARVTRLIDDWAAAREATREEAARWHRAALYHDALKEADHAVLASFTPLADWPRAVWHGPAAAAAAARHGERDTGILDAVRYHSLGFAGWDDVGKALYLADYLEPGREEDRERRAAWARRVADQLETVLREVAAERIARGVRAGKPIHRETWSFWNQLAKAGSPSP